MSCCGGRRAASSRGTGLRSMPARAASHTPPAITPATVTLTYHGPLPMVLPSPSGAAPYRLREPGQTLEVHAGDAGALLHTGWFARA